MQVININELIELIQLYSNTAQYRYVMIGGFIFNILVSIILFIISYRKEFKLKDREKVIFKSNMYAEKQIDVYSKVYIYMNSILDLCMNPRNKANINLQREEFTQYYTQNSLFISEKTIDILRQFEDYCKIVVQDISAADIKQASNFLITVKEAFLSDMESTSFNT